MTGSSWPGSQTSSSRLARPHDRDVVDAELVERPLGGRDLRRAAVDDHQPGRVGELARPAGLGVDQHRAGSAVELARRRGGAR